MARKRLGFMQLTIIFGFSLYYAWYLITFFGLFMDASEAITFEQAHWGQAAFFLGTVVATFALLAVFRRQGSVAIGHKRFMYLMSLIPGLTLATFAIAVATVGFDNLVIFYLADLLTGAAAAFGFMLWEDLVTHGYLNRGVLAHGTIFCAGGVVFLACCLVFSRLEMAIASIVLLAASTGLLAFIIPRCDTIEDKPLEPVRDYFKGIWNIDAVVSTLNVSFGFGFIMLYGQDPAILLVTMACAIFVDLVFSTVFGRGKWLLFAGSVRIFVALASCALILYACLDDFARTAALGMLVVLWFVFRTVNGGSLTDLANRRDFSMLYSSTRGKLPTNVGFMIGLGLGVVAASMPEHAIATLYVPLALVACFIVVALFFLPFDSESSVAGYKTLAIVDMHESPEAGMREACEAASTRYKLSPRESEVLSYLVKGRNAKHIADKLYLSESTVKTHISKIYRKVGVHSQQDLLDQIESLQDT